MSYRQERKERMNAKEMFEALGYKFKTVVDKVEKHNNCL